MKYDNRQLEKKKIEVSFHLFPNSFTWTISIGISPITSIAFFGNRKRRLSQALTKPSDGQPASVRSTQLKSGSSHSPQAALFHSGGINPIVGCVWVFVGLPSRSSFDRPKLLADDPNVGIRAALEMP